jgi:hypothetical protein
MGPGRPPEKAGAVPSTAKFSARPAIMPRCRRGTRAGIAVGVRARRIARGLLLAGSLLAAAPAAADVRILSSPGGPVVPFVALFETLRQSGERVVIDGPCYSACTLVLSMLPRERVCVTRRAVLGFHAARSIDRRGRIRREPEASRLVLETYPKPVQQWIRQRGGLTSRTLFLRGRELAAMLPNCR